MSDFTDLLNKAIGEFRALRQERHAVGAKEYGELTFLGNDVVRMMLEELADTANYCEYQAAKLLLLQGMLEEDERFKSLGVKDGDTEITIGVQAFKGTGAGWPTSD